MSSMSLGVRVLCLVLFAGCCLAASTSEDVSGPVVKLAPLPDESSKSVPPPAAPGNGTEQSKPGTIAEVIDKALTKEFEVETKKESEKGKSFNETVSKDETKLETVVRISPKDLKDKEKEKEKERDASSSSSNSTSVEHNKEEVKDEKKNPISNMLGGGEKIETAVDRIIDSKDNEFVLSSPGNNIASLTVDPQLIQDVTVTFSTASVFGIVFEATKQPVINGYLVAGAVVGPGGLHLVKELVQVESLAQIGVQLLLFGLGLELSMSKIRAVWGVAILGGSLQILLSIVTGAVVSGVLDAPLMQGAFIGALLSMSSTSVVVKCLEVTRSTGTAYGQITIGTLILQDCMVGLMFALMPVFEPSSKTFTAEEATEAKAQVVVMVLKVLVKLGIAVVMAWLVARTLLWRGLMAMQRHASRELCQLTLVAFCLSVAWLCGHYGLSEELGAFLAGAMISMAANVFAPSSGGTAGGSPGPGGPMGTAAGAAGDVHGHGHGHGHEREEGAEAAHKCINSVHNVLCALFVASIGLIMSPKFLWDHIWLLSCGTLVVMVLKSLLVAGVVRFFIGGGWSGWRLALAVGISMAHVGEFAFVLLSMANMLKIISSQVYMLLLGVTAISLLTTPMVISVCNSLLNDPRYHLHDYVLLGHSPAQYNQDKMKMNGSGSLGPCDPHGHAGLDDMGLGAVVVMDPDVCAKGLAGGAGHSPEGGGARPKVISRGGSATEQIMLPSSSARPGPDYAITNPRIRNSNGESNNS